MVRATLLQRSPDGEQREHPLHQLITSIGPDPDNDIFLSPNLRSDDPDREIWGVVFGNPDRAQIYRLGPHFILRRRPPSPHNPPHSPTQQAPPLTQYRLPHGQLLTHGQSFTVGRQRFTFLELSLPDSWIHLLPAPGDDPRSAVPAYIQRLDEPDQRLALTRSRTVIGRSRDNAFVLMHPSVARRHAEIAFDPDTHLYSLQDNGSTNGCYIGDRRLSLESATLHDGDVFMVGGVSMLFRLGRPPHA